jgi:hypothetical protein
MTFFVKIARDKKKTMRLDVRAETLCAPSDIERLSLPVFQYRQVFSLSLEVYVWLYKRSMPRSTAGIRVISVFWDLFWMFLNTEKVTFSGLEKLHFPG